MRGRETRAADALIEIKPRFGCESCLPPTVVEQRININKRRNVLASALIGLS
jgi:hypothetical protein